MNTNKSLNTVSIKKDDLTSIIKSLMLTKAHGFDNISIRMIQLCGDSITVPLNQIFKSLLSQGAFPDTWEKANISTVHKKGAKYLVKNYRRIRLLPIFAKVFEKLNSLSPIFIITIYLPNVNGILCQVTLVYSKLNHHLITNHTLMFEQYP